MANSARNKLILNVIGLLRLRHSFAYAVCPEWVELRSTEQVSRSTYSLLYLMTIMNVRVGLPAQPIDQNTQVFPSVLPGSARNGRSAHTKMCPEGPLYMELLRSFLVSGYNYQAGNVRTE